mmetsp:Transcript_117884/g.204041  ORF Transcript_117884/g.204041 Transcript_117884/m.204041 type:complete len:91 (+) Transcript_117884:102-374(+)
MALTIACCSAAMLPSNMLLPIHVWMFKGRELWRSIGIGIIAIVFPVTWMKKVVAMSDARTQARTQWCDTAVEGKESEDVKETKQEKKKSK